MTKATEIKATNGTNGSDRPEVLQIELQIAKFEQRLAAKKHIDARDFGLNFMFPLLRKLAQAMSVQDIQIQALTERVSDNDPLDEEIVEALETAANTIAELAVLLDQTMVVSGLYVVEKEGMRAATASAEIQQAYAAVGQSARDATEKIQSVLSQFEVSDDDDDDDDEEDGADGNDGDDTEDGDVENNGAENNGAENNGIAGVNNVA